MLVIHESEALGLAVGRHPSYTSLLQMMVSAPERCPNARRAHGCHFDFDAFVASFSSSKARALLTQMRQSQCLEVFINERLLMASKGRADKDDFERKVQHDEHFLHHSELSCHISDCLLLFSAFAHPYEMAMYMLGRSGWLRVLYCPVLSALSSVIIEHEGDMM